jgi:hypothetical protein
MKKSNLLLYLLVPYLILAFVHIWLGADLDTPVVAGDEFQYLGKARYIAGGEMPIYPRGGAPSTFGYSMIISPAFMMFDDPGMIYKAVIAINGIISATLYIWLFLFLFKIMGMKRNSALLVSIILSLYPAFLLQSNMAWTDAITPAFFALIVTSFAFFYKKQDWLTTIIFAIVSSYLFVIHVRGISIIGFNFFFLLFLMRRKVLDVSYGTTVLIINFFIFIFSLSYGDQLSNQMHGSQSSIVLLITRLFERIDLLMIMLSVLISVFISRRNTYFYMGYSIAGITLAFLLRSNVIAQTIGVVVIILAFGLLFLMMFLKQKTVKDFVKIIIMMSVFFTLTYLVVPGSEYVAFILDSFWKWIINVSGKLFYLNVATFGLFSFGMVYSFFYIMNQSDFKWEKLFKDTGSVTLVFMLLNVFGMYFIVTNLGITGMDYRPDRFFYGRYVEVFLAPVFAIALFGIIERKVFTNGYIQFLTLIGLIFSTLLPLLTYGNIIEAEPAFRNFMSFFPLRSAFGSINILLFALVMITGYFFIGFVGKKNKYLSMIPTGVVFILFSATIYIYVIQYHHQNRKERDRIINVMEITGLSNQKVAIDKSMNHSPNMYNYQYQFAEMKAEFVSLNNDTSLSPVILTGNINYIKNNKGSFLLGKEFDTDEYLWLKNSEDTSFEWSNLTQSYLNHDLLDTNIYGFIYNGFFDHRWINGNASIALPLSKKDTARTLWLKCTNNSKRKQNLIIKMNNEEVFDFDMRPGEWEFTIEFEMANIPPYLDVQFYSDLIRNKKNELIGIKVDSLEIRGNSRKKHIDFSKYSLKRDYDIHFNHIYKHPGYDYKSGDTVNYELEVWNINPKVTENNKIGIRLKNFATMETVYESELFEADTSSIFDLKYDFIIPQIQGKYFMEFDYHNGNNWLNPEGNLTRSYVINIE